MKRFLFVLLCVVFAFGANAQDKKITIANIATSSNQGGSEDINNAIDNNTNTLWHSNYNNGPVTFPVTVTLTFNKSEHIDYVRYIPRQGNDNGNWQSVTVAYASTVGANFTNIASYELGGSSSTYDFVIPNGGVDCVQVHFVIYSGKNNFASAAEIQAFAYDRTKEQAFSAYFTDELYTIPNVTNADGIADADVKQLVENLLTQCDNYKKFRVGEYEPYMTPATLQNILKTSSQYNHYENPTGIYLTEGQSCYVAVSGIGENSVGLKIKNWLANENASSYSLHNGLNHIVATSEGNVFVNYFTDNYLTAPNVQIHFINAPVRGYWDQETMTNDDWKSLLVNHSDEDNTILIARSKHAQLAFPISSWKEFCPENIDSTMTLYQSVQTATREMMGFQYLDENLFPNHEVKNRQLFFATSYGFMAAVGDGAYCHQESLGAITRPNAASFDFWGVGHEWGHNNQIAPGFKWTGCGETTNNIYASWAQIKGTPNSLRLEDENSGVNDYSGMRGGRMQAYFEEGLRKGVTWQLQDGPDYHGETPTEVLIQGENANGENIGVIHATWRHYDHFVKLVPFWQLNLWGTLANKCPNIIPQVIHAIRSTENYGTTYNTNGKQQINWMKLACEKAQINLLPFFEKAGMLRPINAYIDDYTKGWNIISEDMISELKSYIEGKNYPAFTDEINYINGHNYHIYRDRLELEVPATVGAGCTYQNGKLKVMHNEVKNAVAFETYNAENELLRITMYALGSDSEHTYTQVLYPSDAEEGEVAAYVIAVGYDGTRTKIYDTEHATKTLEANKYYRIISASSGNALSCGAETTIKVDDEIAWNIARAAKNKSQIDQIWQWQQDGNDRYLFNPQSGHYFGGTANSKTTQLYAEDAAPAWKAVCVDETNNKYTFNIKGSGNYMNAYNSNNTGLWTGGASDNNNLWIVEEVNDVEIQIPATQWSTLCLPFAVNIPENVTAYIVTAESDSYLTLSAIENGVIPANEPVLLEGEEGTYTLTINSETDVTKSDENKLSGTLLARNGFNTVNAEYMALDAETGVGMYWSTEAKIPANKAYYIPQNNEVEALYFNIDNQTTNLDSITNTIPTEEDTFYNLNGRRVYNPTRGIYVTGTGKKVFIAK